jgi:hypothetical protein
MAHQYYFDHDPLTGMVETFEYDELTDLCTIHRRADVGPIIETNKRLQTADGFTGWTGPERDMRLAARIPIEVVNLWRQLYGIDAMRAEHGQAVLKLLNDPSWRYLRTNTSNL